MGDKALVVDPGKEPGTLDANRVHTGSRSPGLDRLFTEAQNLVSGLARIIGRIDSDLDIARLSKSLDETLEKVRETAAAYRLLAQDARKPLTGALERVEAASDDVSSFISDNRNSAARSLESVRNTSERMNALIDSLNSVSAVINTIAVRIESGDGAFAKLVKSDSLYEELRHTNAAVDSFITDFRRNPGNYTRDMKFKLRLF
jgi:methyl-accepting chemotaxis protein